MPEATFGHRLNLPSAGSSFVKLNSKGDKIKFAIANTPHYETHHWLSRTEKVVCEKYNTEDKEAKCKFCDDWKKLLDAGKKDAARQIAPVTTFYYPIVDLAKNVPSIFQFTAKSIHYTISGYAEEDVDVFDCIWVVERTEEKGNYYKILNLGALKLNKEQQEAMAKAKEIKLKAIGESSSVVMGDDVPPPTEE